MTSLPLFRRNSEKYSRTGNISAQGIQKLLGAPSLDQLQTVIRESVQNSCDATVEGKEQRFVASVRKLSSAQTGCLRKNVFPDVLEDSQNDSISDALSADSLWVLELADYGTKGLGGPTDASKVTQDQDVTDFVDFVLNVGSPRDTTHGGGTYGYGKSSLYSLSRCKTILIDSLTMCDGKEVRRFLAARVGSSFSLHTGAEAGKYTGRHWWGALSEMEGQFEPVIDAEALAVATELGLPKRNPGDFGTTIVVLDPIPLVDRSGKEVLNTIQRAFLWNFWPKMLSYSGNPPAMSFETSLDGKGVEVPRPEDCPPLDLFSEAMRELKQGDSEPIVCRRPVCELGALRIVKQQKGERALGFEEQDDGMFPNFSCHVALMRPVELVVKYLEGAQFPSDSVEWGGVFICSDDDEVEKAFASAEPPAHDDWNPKNLPTGNEKTFVRTALRRIKESMENTMSSRPSLQQSVGTYLAPISERMGTLLTGASGDGLSVERPRGRGGKGGGGRKSGVPSIFGFEGWGPAPCESGEILAWFNFGVEGPDELEITLTGKPMVFIDGETSEVAPNGESPVIRVWTDKNENPLGENESLNLTVKDASLIWVGISIPDDVAVTFHPEIRF